LVHSVVERIIGTRNQEGIRKSPGFAKGKESASLGGSRRKGGGGGPGDYENNKKQSRKKSGREPMELIVFPPIDRPGKDGDPGWKVRGEWRRGQSCQHTGRVVQEVRKIQKHDQVGNSIHDFIVKEEKRSKKKKSKWYRL